MKPALLVIDVQNSFFKISQSCGNSLNSAIEYINAAMGLFRSKGYPIFVIQHKDENEGLLPETPDFELPETLNVKPTDPRIIKTYGNSFNKTSLAAQLQELAVDTVIITGFCAEYCVFSTYVGARDLDLKPIILRGAIASGNAEHIRFVEESTETISYGALATLL
jgi:nicotinamidase-related amidase